MAAAYFDHTATTPLDPRVRDAMLPWMGESWGNPSSVHRAGQAAREAVEAARAEVATLLGARPPEIVFTASGTEANNAVLAHVARRAGRLGHVVVSALEHASVREGAARLAAAGVEVTRVSPGRDGTVAVEEIVSALRADTLLVALMLASNELGTLQPVRQVAAACRARGIPILCDAVQGVGKVPVDVEDLGVDSLSLGGHKFNGPLGAAALWVRRGVELDGLLVGGGQERRRRAGTENVPAIVGLGRACALAREELPRRAAHMASLRDRFEAGLGAVVPDTVVHGAAAPRLPNTSHVALRGVAAEPLLIRLDLRGYAVSTGSACASGAAESSPALAAMGLEPLEARASIRLSFGMTNTPAEIDAFLPVLAEEAAALRRLAPVSRLARP